MKYPIYVVLENIRSAFNVGAIFRTADAAGIEKLYLTGITPYPPHNRIPKTALGATESVLWQYDKEPLKVLQDLVDSEVHCIAAELTKNSVNYTDFQYQKPVAIVFGNEINGVSKEALEICETSVAIPMHGQKESLNVEVSFGIIIYEIIRQFNLS